MKNAKPETDSATRQAIHDNSLILLGRFCRMPSGLNVIASWYEDGAMGKIAPNSLLEKTTIDSSADLIGKCDEIVELCKSAVAAFLLAKKSIQPVVILPETSPSVKRLTRAMSRTMPNAALLTGLASYYENGANPKTRTENHFIVMIATRDRILAGKQVLREPITPVTQEILSDIKARAKKDVKPEKNSPKYDPNVDPADILLDLLISDDAKAALLQTRQKLRDADLGITIKPVPRPKPKSRIDPDTPLASFPALAERMPIILSLLHERDIANFGQLEELFAGIVQHNTVKGRPSPNIPGNKPQAYENSARFVAGDIITSGESKNKKLIPSAINIATALKIAPSIAYRDFGFSPSKASQDLDKAFGVDLIMNKACFGDRIPANPSQISL